VTGSCAPGRNETDIWYRRQDEYDTASASSRGRRERHDLPERSLVKRIDRRGLEERALLAAARAGDAHAFRCLLDRHRFGLELYCYLMVGGDVAIARRVLADAVLTAWRERGFVGPETDARMWLYKLASRVCIEAAGDHPPDRGPTSGSCR
jgi:hypothetical protein